MRVPNSRVELLEKRLTTRLDDEAEQNVGCRIVWLARHLEEYLERWLSFATVESISVASTLRNEVFYVVLAATHVMTEEAARSAVGTAFPRDEWEHFRNALEWIQRTADRSDLELVGDTFKAFYKRFPAAEIDPPNEA